MANQPPQPDRSDPSPSLGVTLCVDMGTTNTRVWLVRNREIIGQEQARVGVRDTAKDGNTDRLKGALRDLIARAVQRGNAPEGLATPGSVRAAGMIASPLGLTEVPHVCAPAGIADLRAAVVRREFPDISDLPFFFVPGVRSGTLDGPPDTLHQADVMRGEETLCLGLVTLGWVRPPATVLSLGSHWKAIRIDGEARIASSLTSLSGELVHAAQTQTILASAVPSSRPEDLDLKWCRAGIAEQRRAGLARALFCVRLLELGKSSSPAQRLSFLVGAFIAGDLDALVRQQALDLQQPVFLCGSDPLARAWADALGELGGKAAILSETQIEAGLLGGLREIVGPEAG